MNPLPRPPEQIELAQHHLAWREFLESSPLRGLGESVADIERLLADEPEVLARLREELTADHGGERKGAGRKGKDGIKGNNVPLEKDHNLFDQPEPPKPIAKPGPERGNRKDYTLSRLKKNAPELFEDVKAGRLSANKAAILSLDLPWSVVPRWAQALLFCDTSPPASLCRFFNFPSMSFFIETGAKGAPMAIPFPARSMDGPRRIVPLRTGRAISQIERWRQIPKRVIDR